MVNQLLSSSYTFDKLKGIWSRPAYTSISYSDGDETELRIARIIERTIDITVFSPELRQHCTDWPTLYHLSSTRANILRPFELSGGEEVLEVGSGCGAITRYLGECGANVLALEGSLRRACITRSRTRDQENVTVLAEKFDEFQSDRRFDVITLIGVLEYANLFISSNNPALTMLQRVRSLLKPGGKLIVAIENQLGLKYFAGAPEDHLGQPMYGLEGRYTPEQPQTFGRVALANLMKEADFSTVEFLAPFPDYKLPVSILTEEGLFDKKFDGAALAWQSVRRDPQLPPNTNFSLELTWPEVFKNGLALDMANSFLIVASPLQQKIIKPGVLGYHYSTDRAPQYCKETVFYHFDENKTAVNYRMLSVSRCSDSGDRIIKFTCPDKAVYVEGFPLSLEFVKIVSRDGWSIEEVGMFIRRYINLLSLIADQKGKPVSLLKLTDKVPGAFFDIIPQNIIVNNSGQPIPIDAEWSASDDIEFGWLLFRSLLGTIETVGCFGVNSARKTFSRRNFVKSALAAAGFPVTDEDFGRFIERESIVHQQVTGRASQGFLNQWPEQLLLRSQPLFGPDKTISERDSQIANLEQTIAERDNQITSLDLAYFETKTQLTAVENSTIWKMSFPLRRILTRMPSFRRYCRRTAKLVWWIGTFQLGKKLYEWRARHLDRAKVPHFAPPTDDYCLAIPLGYCVDRREAPLPRVAVICHMFYPEMSGEFREYLKNIPLPFDLLITTDSQEKKSIIENYFPPWTQGKIEVRIAPNRGRDIAPKLITCRDAYDNYEFLLHIHTKRSPHYENWSGWRHYLLETLLGSEKIVESIFESFRSDPKLGIIAPQHYKPVRHSVGWGWNFENARKFARKLNIKLSLDGPIDFPSGSMFWARSDALKPLLDRNLLLDEFATENDQQDGTLAHVIERLYFFVCERAGYRWIKISPPILPEQIERIKHVENQKELINFIIDTQPKLLKFRILRRLSLVLKRSSFTPARRKSRDAVGDEWSELHRLAHEKSDYKNMDFLQFQHELSLHIKKKQSLIDFDEKFYLHANPDVAIAIAQGIFSCGFIHYCMAGQNEGRAWSNYQLKRVFSTSPNFPAGLSAPTHFRPLTRHTTDLSRLQRSSEPFLLVLFSHLQDDLFFAGYTAFFHDFTPIFEKFSRVIISVESEKYNPRLATRYSGRIEVIQERELYRIKYRPELVVAFNSQLFNKAKQIYNDPNRTIYYCQDFESGFFPFGAEYVEAEKAVATAQNIVVSTELLRKFFIDRQLLSHQRVFTTSPKFEVFDVRPEKMKRLFFYFRPESFHRRNLSEILMGAVQDFCEKHSGYEIYMVGSVDTRYSYKVSGTSVYVISKLPKKDYIELISSSDVVISMIYSAHPGVIAFQAAASGIPTVTNTFENRDAFLLRQISENILPYDPVRENLVEVIEEALKMPKGKKSFNEELYSGPKQQSLGDFIDTILSLE